MRELEAAGHLAFVFSKLKVFACSSSVQFPLSDGVQDPDPGGSVTLLQDESAHFS